MANSIQKTVWTLVANSSRARLFSGTSIRGALEEIKDFVHPEARQLRQALKSDAPGRTFDSFGAGRHAKGHKVDAKEQEHIDFAGEIADYLETARAENRYDELVIIAGPEFLGDIRAKITAQTSACVALSINKDITAKSAAEIRKQIASQ